MSACDARQQWEKCIEMCSYFISMFKDHRKWDEMVVVRNEMQAKTDLANLLKMAKQESADEDYEAARRIYMSYLEKNPDSPVKDEIADELAVIDKKLVEKSE